MEKFSLHNRYGLTIIGTISIPKDSSGCAFVEHGLGGIKEQAHIVALADTLFKNGYTVVNFDATNSIGESDGKYEDATMQKHYEDLVDVIAWAKNQSWYREPFVLAGHSLGGYSVVRYAEDHPSEVKGVFPFGLVVSGQLSWDAIEESEPGKMAVWKEAGWNIRISNTKPGMELRLPWSHMEERRLHDLTKHASHLTMPMLFVAGEEDVPCPPKHQKILFDLLPPHKASKFHVIGGALHTFRDAGHLAQLVGIFDAWLKEI